MANIDMDTVAGFEDEWTAFDQSRLSDDEAAAQFHLYFQNFPWHALRADATGFDLGCGTGRWAKQVAPRVGTLHCIDASAGVIEIARRNLKTMANCVFHVASVDSIPIPDDSMDFGYSLGVLHHVPDTSAGLRSCIAKLKVGAPFLVYLYYAFDNRPSWYRTLWKVSDMLRQLISRLPRKSKRAITAIIAFAVYLPLARASYLLEKLGVNVDEIPLSPYRRKSFYTMRTDALDRFGTRLEQRFTREQIKNMMVEAGLDNIVFADQQYWSATGYKR